MFDGRHVDAIRIARLPRLARGPTKPFHELQGAGAIVERNKKHARRRPLRKDLERRARDDSERALGTDEEIDEVHPRLREVAGGHLRHVRHRVARHLDAQDTAAKRELEISVGMRARFPALDVEHVAAREHDGDRLHPVARGSVLEGCGACGVGGDRSADERSRECWRGRVVPSVVGDGKIELGQRDAGPHAHEVRSRPGRSAFRRDVVSTTSPIGVPPPVSDDCAPIASTARCAASAAATSASLAGAATTVECPPGKCAASSRYGRTRSSSALIRSVSGVPSAFRARSDQCGMGLLVSILSCFSCVRRYTRVEMRFAPEYVTYVLNENFEDAKALFLAPLMAIHYSHLVMLAAAGHRFIRRRPRASRRARFGVAARRAAGAPTTARTRICSSTSRA